MRKFPALVIVIVALAVGGIGGSWITAKTGHSIPILVSAPVSAAASQVSFESGFAPVVSKAVPAVVNVSSSKVVRSPGGSVPSPFFSDPFFRQFFGNSFPKNFQVPPSTEREKSLGSGVIVNPNGYILTNNHVINGAKDVKVLLSDNRQFNAKIVGTDAMTDLAVLKIDASNLPVLAFGDSSQMQTGNFVLAIGNPFGLNQTVTLGIVSATGRGGLGIENYEDFIQTDAAINPGNSGGPLINEHGDLIGINTAILTEGGGGNQGVGFAIPGNMARSVMEAILKTGKVSRGWLGVAVQPVTQDLATSFHLSGPYGALVTSVANDSPAKAAGIQTGDIIAGFDGQKLENSRALQLKVIAMSPGTTVKLNVIRDGQARDIVLKLGEAPSKPDQNDRQGDGLSSSLRGISVTDLTPDAASQLPEGTHGVVVTAVDLASTAADAGVQEGDVIEQVNHQPVNDVASFTRAMRHAGNQPALLLIYRDGMMLFAVVQAQ
jgi:serine protease Do